MSFYICCVPVKIVGGRGGSMAGGRDHKFGNSLPCGSSRLSYDFSHSISYYYLKTFKTLELFARLSYNFTFK